jgi:uncharacterized phage protein (TIGR01671 family)
VRAIKFRAWDKVCKEMFYNSELANGDIMVIHLDGRIELSDDDTYKLDDFVIMQYTGLKDKNGKEIYEGDIVAVPYITPLGELTNEIGEKLIVNFEYGRFVLIGGIESQNITYWCKSEKGEYVSNYGNVTILYDETLLNVIGNIYENPELLK